MYVINDVGTLPGYRSSTARGINNRGYVVGYCCPDDLARDLSHRRAFLWKGGHMTDLGALLPRSESSWAYAINNAGDVVGGWAGHREGKAVHRGFLYRAGVMHDLLPFPGDEYSGALGINDPGVVVGSSNVGETPVLWRDPGKPPIEVGPRNPKRPFASALGISQSGTVIGNEDDGNLLGPQAFLWNPAQQNTRLPLGQPGSTGAGINAQGFSVGIDGSATVWNPARQGLRLQSPSNEDWCAAMAINRGGQIVGVAVHQVVGVRAVTWDASAIIRGMPANPVPQFLSELLGAGTGWSPLFADAVNDLGQIAGTGSYLEPDPVIPNNPVTFQRHGFVMTPVRIRVQPGDLSDVVKILSGVVDDSGGVVFPLGGPPFPIGPWGPWHSLPPQLRDALLGLLIAHTASALQDTEVRRELQAAALHLVRKQTDSLLAR